MSGLTDRRSEGRLLLAELRTGFGEQRQLINDGERQLAGVVGGVLWLVAALGFGLLLIPAEHSHHELTLAVVIALGIIGGVMSLTLVPWQRSGAPVFVTRDVLAVTFSSLVIWASGGMHTPASELLLLVVIYASYFYAPRYALVYVLGVVVAELLPLLYAPATIDSHNLLALVFRVIVAVAMCGSVASGRSLIWLHRTRAERFAAQEAAMRAITTSVIQGANGETLNSVAAQELSRLSDHAAVVIVRIDDPATATVMASWPPDTSGHEVRDRQLVLDPAGPVAAALQADGAVRSDTLLTPNIAAAHGFSRSLIAPIRISGAPDGAIVVMTRPEREFTSADEDRVLAFAEMLGHAIRALLDRARLLEQASSDSLTGLANHGVFHAALRAEARETASKGTPLAVAVIDVDDFKTVNDSGGHEFGDRALVRVANALNGAARAADVISRTGGDEFAWIMPGLTAAQALGRVQAARATFEAGNDGTAITLSVGISDAAASDDPRELLRFADAALYWCKANGRNRSQIYNPRVVSPLSVTGKTPREVTAGSGDARALA